VDYTHRSVLNRRQPHNVQFPRGSETSAAISESAGVEGIQVELRATARVLSGAMFSMLDWLVQGTQDISPDRMDAVFHSMAMKSHALSVDLLDVSP
jgi:hypothetical protein